QTMFGNPTVQSNRTTVVVFRFDEDLRNYKPVFDGKPSDADAFFIGGPDETLITFAVNQPLDYTKELIYHEYTHQFFHSLGITMPLWMNEGLAEYFSTVVVKKDRIEFGADKPAHRAVLDHYAMLPLERVFAIGPDSQDYNEGLRQGIFYAESWALIHFWMCGEDRTNYLKFLKFSELLDLPGSEPATCFQEAFSMDYKAMQTLLAKHIQGGRYLIRKIPRPAGIMAEQLKFAPAVPFERDFILENLRVRTQANPLSAERLLRLAERAPDSPRPYEALAALAMLHQDPDTAQSHWRKAAELGSENPYVYLMGAKPELEQIMQNAPLDYRMPKEQAAVLRASLRHAIKLNPGYQLAYEALAQLESVAQKPSIAAANQVQAVLPSMREKARTVLALAVVRWRLNDHATCRQMIELLLASAGVPDDVRSTAWLLKDRIDQSALIQPIPPPQELQAEPAGSR
nr:DUF1570 domain-containing protein [Opitutaceae bacterium]